MEDVVVYWVVGWAWNGIRAESCRLMGLRGDPATVLATLEPARPVRPHPRILRYFSHGLHYPLRITPTYFTLFPPALYYRVFRLEIVSKWVATCIIRRKTGRWIHCMGTLILKSFFNGLGLTYPMPAQLSFPSLTQNKYTRTPGKHKEDDFCYLHQNSTNDIRHAP